MSKTKDLIVQRLISKDKEAFAEVYHAYFGILVNYANRFLDLRENAEEVVQETFVRFWEKCAYLDPSSSVRSYLYRAVHNSCLNALKHDKVRDVYREYMIRIMEKSEEMPGTIDQQADLMDILLEEIQQLPPRCREVFELSRFEGLKYQEIAEHMGISIKTVEVQMGKAFKVLREKANERLKN